MAMASYNAPLASARDDYKVGWALEARQEAEGWMRSQRPYRDLDMAIDLIAGDDLENDVDDPHSDIRIGISKRIIRELVANVSNLRYDSSYRTDFREYDDNAHVLNVLNNAWYVNTRADRRLKTGYQYAAGLGTGYISPVWDPTFHSPRRGDIRLDVYGPRDVYPIQMPADHDLQRCYAVGLNSELPINLARATYQKFAGQIVADRDSPSFLAKGLAAVQKFVSPALRVGNTSKEAERRGQFPTVDVTAFYIADHTINLTDHVIPMGTPSTSWYYEVPYLGMQIPSGMHNAAGQMLYRIAGEEDCRLYPMKRLMITTKTLVLYDDTSRWWHGKMPVIRLTFDKWPWDALGYSVVRDTGTIERSNNRLLRAIDNMSNTRTAPPIMHDENIISRALMETIRLDVPHEEVAVNMSLGDPIKPILPADYYNFPAQLIEILKQNQENAQWLAGSKDMTAMFRGRQAQSADSIEKMLELIGPLATDMARSVEETVAELGAMMLPLFFQYYSAKRRVQIMGKSGLVEQDYDYDPGNMIPSHAPGENVQQPSAVPFMQRAQQHHENFYYWVNPKSMHQTTQMSRKLLILNLLKQPFEKFPLDPWTIARALDLEDEFGPPPEGTHTVMQRALAWRHMARELAIEEAKEMQELGIQVGGGKGQGRGRPQSGQQPPRQVTKDGGTRTATVTSR